MPPAWWYPQLTLTETGHEPLRVNAIETTPNFFHVLGVQPVLGAGFPKAAVLLARDDRVISHRLWRERFGGDPAIVGKTIALNGPLFTVVGVMPQGFQYPNDTDVWHASHGTSTQHSRGAHFMESIFRLKPGMTPDGGERRAAGADQAARRGEPVDQRRVLGARRAAGDRSRRLLPPGAVRAVRRGGVPAGRSPAPTSRACCWRARPCASARWRCARRSARAAAAWCVSS